MKRFYAVQVGDDFSWDFGSTKKREAIKMAKAISRFRKDSGEEIRVATINCDNSFCEEEIIIRTGRR